ncbi:hypothetical protein PF005_g28898 [Phytophthora fragariae]|uniref:Uncharacterized protein n=1 Tax=Phytophthora fragariae TaxID=53985 RepID=A0A6A4C713_9STRA|nr:hypothetical protein PF003_g40096 [Phytophthora fragariae]KAE8925496.1 hypothetical protein PF009_g24294 [Phytophthora fragariae]KAE8977309.1 hypothetical protein PF011_g23704 [Phytophthora fragariae]KAE9097136.1 hypothetical protein PF006_g23639 [Phytophthora fragariae]KAE9164461.1 hypothetical protein PF004_g29817 [Phytophthora fragariae]
MARGADLFDEEDELDTGDLETDACVICMSGAYRPRLPDPPQVSIPAHAAPVPSVSQLAADARVLERENQALRAQYELVSVNNAGLAVHASVLHDHNLAFLRRAHEGYREGMIMLENTLLSRERAEQECVALQVRVASLRDRAGRVDAAEARLLALEDAAAEQYHALQDQFAAFQALVTDLTAQLAAAPPSASSASLAPLFAAQGERDDAHAERDDLRVERDDLRVQFATAQAALPPDRARLDAVVAERDLVKQAVGLAEQQRDDAFSERDRHRRTLVIVEQERDGAVDMRDQARRASVTLRRQRDATVAERDRACLASVILEQQQAATIEELRVARDSLSQSRTEVESAQRLNAPLQDDLRRVNALLVAHAEELCWGTTRIHELEGSVATASTLRVAAKSEMARAQTCSGATHSANLTLVQHALSGYIQVGHIAVWSPFILGSSPIGQKAGSFCQ